MLVKKNSYQNGGDTVNDYILYTQTVLDPSDVIYTDDTPTTTLTSIRVASRGTNIKGSGTKCFTQRNYIKRN